MKTSTKWLLGGALVLIVFFLIVFYASNIYVWMMGKVTTLLIWLVIFIAGWLLGRFGGRKQPKN